MLKLQLHVTKILTQAATPHLLRRMSRSSLPNRVNDRLAATQALRSFPELCRKTERSAVSLFHSMAQGALSEEHVWLQALHESSLDLLKKLSNACVALLPAHIHARCQLTARDVPFCCHVRRELVQN